MSVTVRHLPFREHTTYPGWIKELAAWMSGVQIDSFVGPGWAVIEADDGVTRSTPSGGTTVNHLPAGHLWRTDVAGEPPTTSWIVLQSLPGVVPPNITCQVYFYISSSTNMTVRLFVESNFVTGGPMGGGEPDLPATELGYTGVSGPDTDWYPKFYAVADQSVLIFGWLNEATGLGTLFYVGEIDVPASYGGRADDYPFVIRTTDDTAITSSTIADDRWARHYPGELGMVIGVDTDSYDGMMYNQGGQRILADSSTKTETHIGAMVLTPWMMLFPGTEIQSWARHVFFSGSGRGSFGMTEGNRFLMMTATQSSPALYIRWDGVTGLDS